MLSRFQGTGWIKKLKVVVAAVAVVLELFHSPTVYWCQNLMVTVLQGNLGLSIVLCKVRGPYIGVPWTKEELPRC